MSSLIFLNTRDGEGSDNFNTFWPIQRPHLQNVGHYTISLKNIEFPNTVYPINRFNNIITFNEGGGDLTVTLPPNSYTGTQIAASLATLMSAAGGTYTVTYDAQSKKLTFTETAGPTAFYFVGSIANSGLSELGITTVGSASAATSQVSDVPINVSGTQYVDLVTNLSSLNYSTSTNAHLLARIPVNVAFGEVVFYEPPVDLYLLMSSPDFISFSLVLRDDKNNSWELPSNSYLSMVMRLTPLIEPHDEYNHYHAEVDVRHDRLPFNKKARYD